jgi:DNA polymerase V
MTNRFKPSETQYSGSKTVSPPVATADSAKLAKAAMMALGALWRPHLRYKKAGVILLDLAPAGKVQGDLWEGPDTLKSGWWIISTKSSDAIPSASLPQVANGRGG